MEQVYYIRLAPNQLISIQTESYESILNGNGQATNHTLQEYEAEQTAIAYQIALETAKMTKKNELYADLQSIIEAGFTYEGNTYAITDNAMDKWTKKGGHLGLGKKADEVAQVIFDINDNMVVTNVGDLRTMLDAIGDYWETNVYYLKDHIIPATLIEIDNCTTIEQVEAIEWN